MRFDLTDLRLFLAIVEAGSITHGAAASSLSLGAASERLREMEAAGRVRLLDRGRRGVAPTPAGEALAHHARLILGQMTRMRGDLAEHAQGIRATVRLLANTAAMTEFLPDPLGAWLAAHPRIDVDLQERQSAEIVKAIASGLADLGVISEAAAPSGLRLHPFAVDRLAVVAARDHPLVAGRQVAFADVLDAPQIGLGGGALQAHLEDQAARQGRPLAVRVRVRTFDAVCRMAARGAGVGIVPETAARRSRRLAPFAIMRLSDTWAQRRLCVCHGAEAPLAPAAAALLAHLSAGA